MDGWWNDDSHMTYVSNVSPLPSQFCPMNLLTLGWFIFHCVINLKLGRAEVLELHPAHGFQMTINAIAVWLLLEVIKSFAHGIYACFCKANPHGCSHKWLTCLPTQVSLFSAKNIVTSVCLLQTRWKIFILLIFCVDPSTLNRLICTRIGKSSFPSHP